MSLPLLIAWSLAPGEAFPSPLSGPDRVAPADTTGLPPSGVTPIEDAAADTTHDEDMQGLSTEGVAPLAPAPLRLREPSASALPPDGVTPLELSPLSRRPEPPPVIATPLGSVPPATRAVPLDRRLARMVRLDTMFGPMFRTRRVDTMVSTSAEFGRMHGFSAAFMTGVIVDAQREVVKAIDVPIDAGAILRGSTRRGAVSGSVGVLVGMLVHRAKSDQGVIHRVDPDFRFPIRFAWTIEHVGISVLVDQGYSVRNRSYERRGVEVWSRHAYRVGFAIGLHYDIMAGRAKPLRRAHRKVGS